MYTCIHVYMYTCIRVSVYSVVAKERGLVDLSVTQGHECKSNSDRIGGECTNTKFFTQNVAVLEKA